MRVRPREWTSEECQYLRKHALKHTDAEIADALDRTRGSVSHKRKQIGIVAELRRVDTLENREVIMRLWDKVSTIEIGKRIGFDQSSVYKLAYKMGLSQNLAAGPSGFRKGTNISSPFAGGWPVPTGPTAEAVAWAKGEGKGDPQAVMILGFAEERRS